jgi:hypothetical protein
MTALPILVASVPQFGKDLEIVSYLWLPLGNRYSRSLEGLLRISGSAVVGVEKGGTWLVDTRRQCEAGDVRSMRSASSVVSAPNRAFGPTTEADF